MTQKTIFLLITYVGIFIGLQDPAVAGKCGRCCPAVTATRTSTNALSAAEVEDLLFMREEEKLARDVYNAMHELYDQRVFINIPRAEQRHMDAILSLLNAYGLDDPVLSPGKFGNKELRELYDALVERGSESRQEAYRVGALIEEVDIEDLEHAMQRTDQENIRAVYENLLAGSKRHLNAFVRNYEAVSGKTYVAQHLQQKEVDEILGR